MSKIKIKIYSDIVGADYSRHCRMGGDDIFRKVKIKRLKMRILIARKKTGKFIKTANIIFNSNFRLGIPS